MMRALPKATIFDVDGTLVDVHPYRHLVQRPKGEQDFDAFHRAGTTEAKLIPETLQLLREARAARHIVLVVSGRAEKWATASTRHLMSRLAEFDLNGAVHQLYYRPRGFVGSDPYLKTAIFEKHIAGRYDVVHAVDDQPVIARVWRSLGIPRVTLIPGWTDADEASMGYGADVYERWPA